MKKEERKNIVIKVEKNDKGPTGGLTVGKYKGKYTPIKDGPQPFQYKKVLREGTEGPTAEKGSRVSISWRFKKNRVEELIEKSHPIGDKFKLNDPDEWTYQMVGQKMESVLSLKVN